MSIRLNILIVEDDPYITKLLLSCIDEIDGSIRVITATKSGEAWSIACKDQIDLFILDIQLSDYKGTTLAHQLRIMAPYSYTPILFATALAGNELTAFREIKCYGFLIKPFTKDEVISVLTDTIRYSQHLTYEQKHTLRIEQKSHIFEYELQQIVYIESFGKNLELHLRNSKDQTSSERISGLSLKKMLELLGSSSFVQCHKSYIINTSYITRIDKTHGIVELTDTLHPIPMGQKYKDNLVTRGAK
ncbi:two-component system LytT family response regulator [Paenibacillus shirakamiensis]|uniref:Two-component system LytT family response regulator n=1 Tax=Paenibacillus shirakamiensis TaxID=1265935 RepID=A0ABS4JKL9_9BACL|nr:LytTR family DNA-binding domain-containing protein [Paenibacillus shirakamiensis]MBP2002260.1 two-component system LytT family response regulator [Paenibacillus shirakamiensis]